MASPRIVIPRRSAFRLHARQFEQRRYNSNTPVNPSAGSIFKPASSVISPWRAVTGAQEWQTSSYFWNKHTNTNLPAITATAEKLLRDYATMVPKSDTAARDSRSVRNAIAERRKSTDKIHVSGTKVKDYGSHVVIDAYVFDGIEAQAEELRERYAGMQKRAAQRLANRKSNNRTPRAPGTGQPRPAGARPASGFRPRPAGGARPGFAPRAAGGAPRTGAPRTGTPRTGSAPRPAGASNPAGSGPAFRSLKLDNKPKS